ncbi:type II toxin-antitoxin system RelE/ParE family toxin [Limibacterium fermenti]|uniref:type II toxin-antitoxin system RelE/ParE family toxin n=1 Tax=Limibacterium fermenti TaxID=3229863 RepID=UPI000E7F18D0|nr:hypothetical protein [Porphyromonadaceae bacterium]
MNDYNVVLSQEAEADLQDYIDYIMSTYKYKAPLTALRHYEDIFNILRTLNNMPESYSIQTGTSFLRFGANVRRINYKKMAIIYTVHGGIVYIHRIIAANLIKNL